MFQTALQWMYNSSHVARGFEVTQAILVAFCVIAAFFAFRFAVRTAWPKRKRF